MQRILYFNGDNMVAQEWVGHNLEDSVWFESNEPGLDQFAVYLKSFKNQPIRLLVDLVEEEFRQVAIPLLRGSDRQAMLQRNFTRFFRDSEFRVALSRSIEKSTRREEKLLLLGLTHPNLLQPWLSVINDTQTPLSGIISLPLLCEDLVTQIGAKDHTLILINQTIPDHLRQSVFIDGKLIFSRLVPVTGFYRGDYAGDLLRDLETMQRYLISQRIIENVENMAVYIITNKRHKELLIMKFAEMNFSDVHIHEINQLLAAQKIIVTTEQDCSLALFCYLASKKISLNHYARGKWKKYYRHNLANLIFKLTAVVILASGVGLSSASLIKSRQYNNAVADNLQIEQSYQIQLAQLSRHKADAIIPARHMQHIVQTIEDIKKGFLHDPQAMMVMISEAISVFTNIRVKKMEWFVSDFSDTETAGLVVWDKQKSTGNGFFQIARVEAEFLNFDGNYRAALSMVDELEKIMLESGHYFHIDITQKPLNIEPDNRLSGDVGERWPQHNVQTGFVFRVIRKIGGHE